MAHGVDDANGILFGRGEIILVGRQGEAFAADLGEPAASPAPIDVAEISPW